MVPFRGVDGRLLQASDARLDLFDHGGGGATGRDEGCAFEGASGADRFGEDGAEEEEEDDEVAG